MLLREDASEREASFKKNDGLIISIHSEEKVVELGWPHPHMLSQEEKRKGAGYARLERKRRRSTHGEERSGLMARAKEERSSPPQRTINR